MLSESHIQIEWSNAWWVRFASELGHFVQNKWQFWKQNKSKNKPTNYEHNGKS